jgi:hypothetical protein
MALPFGVWALVCVAVKGIIGDQVKEALELKGWLKEALMLMLRFLREQSLHGRSLYKM